MCHSLAVCRLLSESPFHSNQRWSQVSSRGVVRRIFSGLRISMCHSLAVCRLLSESPFHSNQRWSQVSSRGVVRRIFSGLRSRCVTPLLCADFYPNPHSIQIRGDRRFPLGAWWEGYSQVWDLDVSLPCCVQTSIRIPIPFKSEVIAGFLSGRGEKDILRFEISMCHSLAVCRLLSRIPISFKSEVIAGFLSGRGEKDILRLEISMCHSLAVCRLLSESPFHSNQRWSQVSSRGVVRRIFSGLRSRCVTPLLCADFYPNPHSIQIRGDRRFPLGAWWEGYSQVWDLDVSLPCCVQTSDPNPHLAFKQLWTGTKWRGVAHRNATRMINAGLIMTIGYHGSILNEKSIPRSPVFLPQQSLYVAESVGNLLQPFCSQLFIQTVDLIDYFSAISSAAAVWSLPSAIIVQSTIDSETIQLLGQKKR